jgi:predicted Zn-dependent protease
MADFSAIKSFQKEKLSLLTFHPKTQKPIEAVLRHLQSITPAEEIYGH